MIKLGLKKIFLTTVDSKSGACNYFCLRTTSRLHKFSVGKISVNKANFKLKIGLEGPDVAHPALNSVSGHSNSM